MWRKIFREIVILNLCLAIFPLAVVILVYLEGGASKLAYALLPVGSPVAEWISPREGLVIALAMLELAPYLVVQCIRGFFWSERSMAGRKWTNLYFTVLLAATAGWSFWGAWDLFYFMYALGDIPAELSQFLKLEVKNILMFIGSVALGVRCFGIFLDPAKKPPKSSWQ